MRSTESCPSVTVPCLVIYFNVNEFQEEDAQPLTEPIVAPVRKNKFQHVEQELPYTTYDAEFMADMMDNGCLVRFVDRRNNKKKKDKTKG